MKMMNLMKRITNFDGGGGAQMGNAFEQHTRCPTSRDFSFNLLNVFWLNVLF